MPVQTGFRDRRLIDLYQAALDLRDAAAFDSDGSAFDFHRAGCLNGDIHAFHGHVARPGIDADIAVSFDVDRSAGAGDIDFAAALGFDFNIFAALQRDFLVGAVHDQAKFAFAIDDFDFFLTGFIVETQDMSGAGLHRAEFDFAAFGDIRNRFGQHILSIPQPANHIGM